MMYITLKMNDMRKPTGKEEQKISNGKETF